MKKILFLFTLIISMLSCHKDENHNYNNTVLIKGKIESAKKDYNTGSFYFGEKSLADARNVVVFTGERYTVVEIVNNSFSLEAPIGSATALIFVDAANQYIGNLTVSGLNILPLVNLSDGDNTVIDLSTLTLYETSVIPANNPIGKEILISQEDIELLREISSLYEAISKNLDADNDGVLDNFTGKQLVINSGFDLMAGNFGVNTTPAIRLDSDSYLINYGFRISGWNTIVPEVLEMSLNGPEGNPHPDIFSRGYNYDDNCECFNAFFMRQQLENQEVPVELPFRKGIYTFSLDGINFFTLEYASIDARYFLLLAEPVIITNQEGKVTRVEIRYMLPDGSPVDQSKFITTLALQFHNESNLLYQEGSMFDLMNILPDFEKVDIAGNVDIQTITNLSVNYTDLVGNTYSIDWKKR